MKSNEWMINSRDIHFIAKKGCAIRKGRGFCYGLFNDRHAGCIDMDSKYKFLQWIFIPNVTTWVI